MEPTAIDQRMGELFRQGREALGWSLDDAMIQASVRYPDLSIKRGKIHRIEKGVKDRDRLNVITLVALAEMYGLPLSELPDDVQREIRASRDLLAANSPCSPDPGHGRRSRHLTAA